MDKLFEVIYEDADLLVINKPAGLVCHPTKGDEYSSLISRARIYLQRQMSRDNFPMPHLVNRLDRETSGVTVVAKSAGAAGELGKIWEGRNVEKEYLAIVHGHVRDEFGLIDAPLGRDEHSPVAVKDRVRQDGAAARTEFFVERRFLRSVSRAGREVGEANPAAPPIPSRSPRDKLPPAFSLLRVLPRTGRKHQIRIHLAHIGHPIVGDKLYGGDADLYLALVENRLTDRQRERLIFENHALHARTVRFFWRGETKEFSCEPEGWFKEFIGQIFFSASPRPCG